MKVLVVGAGGNLGLELVRAFMQAGHEVAACDRAELDVTDETAVRTRVMGGAYGAVLNAVAYNDVDGAEDPANRKRAWDLNAEAPRFLAEAARASGAAFIHFSTDYVFEGAAPGGYREDDAPHPISEYGKSKRAGEVGALSVGGRAYVVRTSRIFGPQGTSASSKPGFVGVMLRLAKEKPELAIVDEEAGCPTYTRDVAEATARLLGGAYAPGIYHFVNEGPGVTWYGFAEEFFGLLGVATPRKPVPATPRPAKRPAAAVLLNTKFPKLRPRAEALRAFFKEYPPA